MLWHTTRLRMSRNSRRSSSNWMLHRFGAYRKVRINDFVIINYAAHQQDLPPVALGSCTKTRLSSLSKRQQWQQLGKRQRGREREWESDIKMPQKCFVLSCRKWPKWQKANAVNIVKPKLKQQQLLQQTIGQQINDVPLHPPPPHTHTHTHAKTNNNKLKEQWTEPWCS